jgi:ankyrin repeat protein
MKKFAVVLTCILFLFNTISYACFNKQATDKLHEILNNNKVTRHEVLDLYTQGADVNAPDEHGNTPLHHAGRLSNPDVIATLLKLGAQPNTLNKEGLAPFHHAAFYRIDCTDIFLRAGANFTLPNKSGTAAVDLKKNNVEAFVKFYKNAPDDREWAIKMLVPLFNHYNLFPKSIRSNPLVVEARMQRAKAYLKKYIEKN